MDPRTPCLSQNISTKLRENPQTSFKPYIFTYHNIWEIQQFSNFVDIIGHQNELCLARFFFLQKYGGAKMLLAGYS